MKNIIKTLTHMLFWGTFVLLCWALFESRGQMMRYAFTTTVLAGILYWMRVKIEKMWIFIASHLVGMAGGIVLIFAFQLKTWYVAYWVLLFLCSVVLRCVVPAHEFDEPSNLYVGGAAVIYGIAWILNGDAWAKGVSLCTTILLFLLKLLYDNLQAADWFIKVRNLSEDCDARKASHFSKQISFLYTGGIGILLGLFAFISMDGVWQAIKAGMYRFLVYLVSLIPQGEPPAVKEKVPVRGESGPAMLDAVVEQKEPSLLAETFDAVAPVVTAVIVVALALVIIITIVMGMYRGFYRKRVQEDENLQVEKLKADKKVTRVKRRQMVKNAESNPARRIRKIYKKNMHKLGEHTLRDFPYMTPEKQVQKHRETYSKAGDGMEVRDIYEKARYGKESVTDADVERMKSLM